MTADDLETLTVLHEKATPDPWFVRNLSDDLCMSALAVGVRPDDDVYGFSFEWNADEMVAACLVQSPEYILPADGRYRENAELIAAMRNALPELIRLARKAIEAGFS